MYVYVCVREREREWVCTLKSMPTVEIKLPARKAPSLNRTSRHVFPTPESPTSITWDKERKRWEHHPSHTHEHTHIHSNQSVTPVGIRRRGTVRESLEPSFFQRSCQTKIPVHILHRASCLNDLWWEQTFKIKNEMQWSPVTAPYMIRISNQVGQQKTDLLHLNTWTFYCPLYAPTPPTDASKWR